MENDVIIDWCKYCCDITDHMVVDNMRKCMLCGEYKIYGGDV